MNENRTSPWRRRGSALAGAAGLLLVGAVLLAWSWNAFVSEVLGLPPLSLRQALAAEVLIGIVCVVAVAAGRRRLLGTDALGRRARS
jgi:hypothetical protein